MISGIIKVEASPASADYNCIIHCFMKNIQKLLCQMQLDFICASKYTKTNGAGGRITRNH